MIATDTTTTTTTTTHGSCLKQQHLQTANYDNRSMLDHDAVAASPSHRVTFDTRPPVEHVVSDSQQSHTVDVDQTTVVVSRDTLKRSESALSHDNPFQMDSELSLKADYIVKRSTFTRNGLTIEDPDLVCRAAAAAAQPPQLLLQQQQNEQHTTKKSNLIEISLLPLVNTCYHDNEEHLIVYVDDASDEVSESCNDVSSMGVEKTGNATVNDTRIANTLFVSTPDTTPETAISHNGSNVDIRVTGIVRREQIADNRQYTVLVSTLTNKRPYYCCLVQ